MVVVVVIVVVYVGIVGVDCCCCFLCCHYVLMCLFVCSFVCLDVWLCRCVFGGLFVSVLLLCDVVSSLCCWCGVFCWLWCCLLMSARCCRVRCCCHC